MKSSLSSLCHKLLLLGFAIVWFSLPSFAQTSVYHSGQMFVDSGVVITVNGIWENSQPAGQATPPLLENNGEIRISNALSVGSFVTNTPSIVRGNGSYRVEQDWVNRSPSFIANNSIVYLDGDVEQLITGTEVTTFNQLVLEGDGLTGTDRVKRMEIDVIVDDTLFLNNREMAADSFGLFIENPNPKSLQSSTVVGDEGFVSSLLGTTDAGFVSRRTSNSSEAYLFPVGSSINPPAGKEFVYRPVELTPTSASQNVYNVRFTFNDPSADGYDVNSFDTSICTVNELYYHMINRTDGFDSAFVTISYDPLEDGIYDRLGQWEQDSEADSLWRLLSNSSLATGANYNRLSFPNNPVFSNDSLPFALVDLFPEKPSLTGPSSVCSNTNGVLFVAESNTDFYEWITPAGVQIASGADNDSIRLNFGVTGGLIRAVAASATGRCKEASDSLIVVINPSPIAGFLADSSQVFTGFDIQFTDTSLGAPTEWLWQFGDGDSSIAPTPRHSYEDIGEFTVVLFIRDNQGCVDSTSARIRVIEGINIPNVFTPNGDGYNDLFRIENSGIISFNIQIFNRWGNLLFETTAPEIVWDGRTPGGEEVQSGTYFYVLKAKSEVQDYSTTGFITVTR